MSGGIQIEVPGVPVAKGRPRFSTAGRFPRVFTPKKTADYEKRVRSYAAVQMAGRSPMEGPLTVTVTAHLPIPASWSAKKRAAAIFPTSKPDTDNFLKAALDALNGIAFMDDSQVVDVRAVKVYSAEPRLSITVWPASELAMVLV